MLKAYDACADMRQLERTVPIWNTFPVNNTVQAEVLGRLSEQRATLATF